MSAAAALQAAHAAGIQLRIDGDDLILRAPAPPPAPVIDILSRHKADVMRMLRSGEWHSPEGGWSVEEWLVFFDERAGVAEFDGGLPRPQAEVEADTQDLATAYEPTEHERAALKAYFARDETCPPAPRMKVVQTDGAKAFDIDHPNPVVARVLLMEALGTRDRSFLNGFLQ